MAEKDCTEKEWLPRLKLGNTWRLMDNKHWGRTSSEQLVDALAAVLPPEKMEELNTLAANLKAPDEPGYTGPLEEEAKKLANAKEEFIQGWALEVAARKLGLSPRSIFDENPAIHEKVPA